MWRYDDAIQSRHGEYQWIVHTTCKTIAHIRNQYHLLPAPDMSLVASLPRALPAWYSPSSCFPDAMANALQGMQGNCPLSFEWWWAIPLSFCGVTAICMAATCRKGHVCLRQHLRRAARGQVADIFLIAAVLLVFTYNLAWLQGVIYLTLSRQVPVLFLYLINTEAVVSFFFFWWMGRLLVLRDPFRAATRNWTLAASHDAFGECAGVIRREQFNLLGFFVVVAALMGAFTSTMNFMDVNSGGINVTGALPVYAVLFVFVTYFQLVTIMRPEELKNQAVAEAVVRSGDVILRRSKRAPLAYLAMAFTVACMGVLYSWALYSPVVNGMWSIWLVIPTLLVLTLMGPKQLASRLASCCTDFPLKKATPASMLSIHEGSVIRTRRLLLVALLSWQALPQVDAAIFITWVVSGATLALLLLVHDREVGFEDIIDSPGFGLLVDARDLEAALRVTLSKMQGSSLRHDVATGSGSTSEAGPIPFAGPIRRYKATFFRMQRAVAISYRWQTTEVVISRPRDGAATVSLNMSEFQLGELLRHVASSWVDYVWLDKLSVAQSPQSPEMQQLQRTLLARMMAVYAGADHTLVLRSLEAEAGRYHQRAWTCQEYCCARRLVVCSEEGGGDLAAEDSPRAAMTDEEAGRMEALRSEVQSCMLQCRPVWLLPIDRTNADEEGADTAGQNHAAPLPEAFPSHMPDLRQRMELYEELSSRVHCMAAADRVRALAPMVFNSPAERHEELVMLMEKVAGASEGPASGVMWEALETIRADGQPAVAEQPVEDRVREDSEEESVLAGGGYADDVEATVLLPGAIER